MGIYLYQNHFNECNEGASVKYNDWINFKEHFLLERKFEKLIKISDFKNCDLNRDFNQCDFNQTTLSSTSLVGSCTDQISLLLFLKDLAFSVSEMWCFCGKSNGCDWEATCLVGVWYCYVITWPGFTLHLPPVRTVRLTLGIASYSVHSQSAKDCGRSA